MKYQFIVKLAAALVIGLGSPGFAGDNAQRSEINTSIATSTFVQPNSSKLMIEPSVPLGSIKTQPMTSQEMREVMLEVAATYKPKHDKIENLIRSDFALRIADYLTGRHLKNFRLAIGSSTCQEEMRRYFLKRLIPYNQTSEQDASLEYPLAFFNGDRAKQSLESTLKTLNPYISGTLNVSYKCELEKPKTVLYDDAVGLANEYYDNIFKAYGIERGIGTDKSQYSKKLYDLRCYFLSINSLFVEKINHISNKTNKIFILDKEYNQYLKDQAQNQTREVLDLIFISNLVDFGLAPETSPNSNEYNFSIKSAKELPQDRLRYFTRKMLNSALVSPALLFKLSKDMAGKPLEKKENTLPELEGLKVSRIWLEEIIDYQNRTYYLNYNKEIWKILSEVYYAISRINNTLSFRSDLIKSPDSLVCIYKMLPLFLISHADEEIKPMLENLLKQSDNVFNKIFGGSVKDGEILNILKDAHLYIDYVKKHAKKEYSLRILERHLHINSYMGELFLRMGKYAQAIEIFKELIKSEHLGCIVNCIKESDANAHPLLGYLTYSKWYLSEFPASLMLTGMGLMARGDRALAQSLFEILSQYNLNLGIQRVAQYMLPIMFFMDFTMMEPETGEDLNDKVAVNTSASTSTSPSVREIGSTIENDTDISYWEYYVKPIFDSILPSSTVATCVPSLPESPVGIRIDCDCIKLLVGYIKESKILEGKTLKNFRLALGSITLGKELRDLFVSSLIPYNQTSYQDASLESPLASLNPDRIRQNLEEDINRLNLLGSQTMNCSYQCEARRYNLLYEEALLISEEYYDKIISAYTLFLDKTGPLAGVASKNKVIINTNLVGKLNPLHDYFSTIDSLFVKRIRDVLFDDGYQGPFIEIEFLNYLDLQESTQEALDLKFISSFLFAVPKPEYHLLFLQNSIALSEDRLRYLTRKILKSGLVDSSTFYDFSKNLSISFCKSDPRIPGLKDLYLKDPIKYLNVSRIFLEEAKLYVNQADTKIKDKFDINFIELNDVYYEIFRQYALLSNHQMSLVYIYKILRSFSKAHHSIEIKLLLNNLLEKGDDVLIKSENLLKKHQYADAIDTLKEAALYHKHAKKHDKPEYQLRILDKNLKALSITGIILFQMGETAQALEKFQEVVPSYVRPREDMPLNVMATTGDTYWFYTAFPAYIMECAMSQLYYKSDQTYPIRLLQLLSQYGVNMGLNIVAKGMLQAMNKT